MRYKRGSHRDRLSQLADKLFANKLQPRFNNLHIEHIAFIFNKPIMRSILICNYVLYLHSGSPIII
ncbi:hypothetical protein BM607_016415 [Shewanella sp. SACH]|nr:hypothetical protein BM607_016415 [Shewanella sp. SACH]